MKTIIFNGSARKNGDTAFLVHSLTSQLSGDVQIIDCCGPHIAPCRDCRFCKSTLQCSIDDDMQHIYGHLADCDQIVLASPVHYGTLSAELLKTASRFQIYSSAMIFRREQLSLHAKKGAVLLAQGGSGGAEQAYETAKIIFRSIGISNVFPMICSKKTDSVPASQDMQTLKDVRLLADWMNT